MAHVRGNAIALKKRQSIAVLRLKVATPPEMAWFLLSIQQVCEIETFMGLLPSGVPTSRASLAGTVRGQIFLRGCAGKICWLKDNEAPGAGPGAATKRSSGNVSTELNRKIERYGDRRKIYEPAWIVDPDVGFPNECALRDLSIGGAMVETSCARQLPEYLFLISSREDHAIECKVRWRSDRALGIEFL